MNKTGGFMIIELEGKKFDVDIEKTKKYYSTHSLCECVGCRNLYEQIEEKYPVLKDFLKKFGIDISKPDEASWIDAEDNRIDYLAVYYTVNGAVIQTDKKDITISTDLSISFDKDYAPNSQKSQDYFMISVCGIDLPYIFDEPLTLKVKRKKKR